MYKKYEFVYFDPKKYSQYDGEQNKIDNFWFAKKDVPSYFNSNLHDSNGIFFKNMNEEYWTKNFYFETKYLPFYHLHLI